jgi:hypothetical protein
MSTRQQQRAPLSGNVFTGKVVYVTRSPAASGVMAVVAPSPRHRHETMPTGTNPLLPRPATRWQQQLKKQAVANEPAEAAERAVWALQRATALYDEEMTQMAEGESTLIEQHNRALADRLNPLLSPESRQEAGENARSIHTALRVLQKAMVAAEKKAKDVFDDLGAEVNRTAAIASAFVKSRVNELHTNTSLYYAVQQWLKGGNERRRIEDWFGPITNWNTSNVTDMSMLFAGVEAIDLDVTLAWDTRNVTSMQEMFANANFDNGGQPLLWDTQNVKTMRSMFEQARSFNQPLPWDTRNVKDMGKMFKGASAFNQPLKWDTRQVVHMMEMFSFAMAFNGTIEFDTRSVKFMEGMFYNASRFDRSLVFDTGKVENMTGMFDGAARFNNRNMPLSWNTEKVTEMTEMFKDASEFNQTLNFITHTVETMDYVFYHATAFNNGNRPLLWDTRSVENMGFMFCNATSFNQPLEWDTKNVKNMGYMFEDAEAFDQPLEWDTSNVHWDQEAPMFDDTQPDLPTTTEAERATDERRKQWDFFYDHGGWDRLPVGGNLSVLHQRLNPAKNAIQATKAISNGRREQWNAQYAYDVLMRIQQSLVEASNASSDDEAARILQKPILASNAYTRPYFALDESIFTTNEIGLMRISKILQCFISVVNTVYMTHAHNHTSEIAKRISDLWEMLMATLLNWDVSKKEAKKPEVLTQTKRRFEAMQGTGSDALIAAAAAAAAERLSKGMLLMRLS